MYDSGMMQQSPQQFGSVPQSGGSIGSSGVLPGSTFNLPQVPSSGLVQNLPATNLLSGINQYAGQQLINQYAQSIVPGASQTLLNGASPVAPLPASQSSPQQHKVNIPAGTILLLRHNTAAQLTEIQILAR